MGNQKELVPHVLIFPLPIQAPVSYMLKLAEILCLDEAIKVTFLTIPYIQHRLFHYSDTQTHFAKYPNFRFETIPDGLPENNPRTVVQFAELMQSLEALAGPAFEEIITAGPNPVSCVISEGLFNFPTEIAKKNGVPFLCFDTLSPCAVLTHLSLPKLLQAGELPFKAEEEAVAGKLKGSSPGWDQGQLMTKSEAEVISAEWECQLIFFLYLVDYSLSWSIACIVDSKPNSILRRRDLTNFCRSHDVLNHPEAQLVLNEINNIPQAQALILNTFQALDAPILSQISKINPNIYAIGPLQAQLKTRLVQETGVINSNNLWKEDRSCLSWLDQQPSKSVIYVSIGSLVTMTKDQLIEIWHGLVSSGSRFLWVRRPGSVSGIDLEPDQVPLELSKGTKERGYIVSWAPQEEVLAHAATGGFLTHSGWSSTLESIVEGKPMICWPYFADQHVSSRYVGEVWKLGLDMKDTCDRITVEKMIREVMGSRNDEFFRRAEEMAKLAKLSVSQGGSSFADLDRLIQDIKMMKLL
ncbi:hypothetical protein ACS0TY_000942 [Phlomoides rotata]